MSKSAKQRSPIANVAKSSRNAMIAAAIDVSRAVRRDEPQKVERTH